MCVCVCVYVALYLPIDMYTSFHSYIEEIFGRNHFIVNLAVKMMATSDTSEWGNWCRTSISISFRHHNQGLRVCEGERERVRNST